MAKLLPRGAFTLSEQTALPSTPKMTSPNRKIPET